MPAGPWFGLRRCALATLLILVVLASSCGSDEPPSEVSVTTTTVGSTTVESTTTTQATTTTTTGATTPTGESTESIANVERLVDDFYAALEDTDPQAASQLFADDGVLVDKNLTEWVGTSHIVAYVEMVGPSITSCERTGEVEVVGNSSYILPIEFTYKGLDFSREAAVTVDNGLISSHQWIQKP